MVPLHLLFTLILSFLPAGNSDITTEKAALLRLSSAVRGRTRQWDQSNPTPCLWKGVTCDTTNNTVTALRLPGCALSGQIPLNSIGNLTQLRNLSLGRNSLSGSLPPDLGSCTELRFLFLQENQFSSEIPATLFGLKNLIRLSLAGNNFSGEISPDFNNLTMLRALYLENNQLTGSLPELDSFSALRIFNVSFNNLNGSIPPSLTRFSSESFLGTSLCNSPLNSCPNKNTLSGGAIAGIVIGSVFGLILILFVIFILWRKYSTSISPPAMSPMPPSPVKSPELQIRSPNPIIVTQKRELDNGFSGVDTGTRVPGHVIRKGDDGLVFFGDGVRGFNLEELLMASAQTLGKGTFGTTYKAYLKGDDGGEVIVKRLRNVFVDEREFREKVEKLGVLVHPNLVPPRAYYYGKEEKLLVYDWMPMGSLSALLHGNRGAERSLLTWEARSRIAFQAALGIEYLHSLGPNVTHGSIKSSNIFLTEQNGACVSEFGITQLVSSTTTPNLIGYRAPEVMDSQKISQKADVYSFGVVLLELLTGKSATNALSEEGVELARWVESVVEEKWSTDVFDPELPKYQNIERQMVQLLQLAIYCASQEPGKRPSMVDVIRLIKKICGSRQQR